MPAQNMHENATESIQSYLSEISENYQIGAQTYDTISAEEPSIILDSNDPVTFCGRRLKFVDINMMLNAGPCQPTRDYRFPVVNNRSFNPDWFSCNMVDKTTYQRKWLSFSRSANRAYCLPCVAFSGPRGSDMWTSSSFCDWYNGAHDVLRHECSAEHRKSEIAVHQWRRGNTVNQMAAENIGALVEDNRNLHNLLTVNIYKVCMDLPVCIVH